MEQRKLVLPAFHGEKMARLGGLMAEVAEREVESWPRGGSIPLQPRMQRLTLEIILRAVFGLDPGPRLDALRERLGELLAFGDRPISLMPPDPDGLLARILERFGPFAEFVRLQQETDAPPVRADRRATRRGRRARRRARDAARGAPRGRLADVRPGASRRADDPARRRPRDDRLLARLGVRAPGPPARACSLDWWTSSTPTATPTSSPRSRRPCAAGPCFPTSSRGWSRSRSRSAAGRTRPGVCLVPNAYLVHHDPEIYPDPYEFRPERFLDEPPGTYTWIPFGGGRRRCIGASFAMLEMQIVIRTVLDAPRAPAGARRRRARHAAQHRRPARAGARSTALGDRRPAAVAAASALDTGRSSVRQDRPVAGQSASRTRFRGHWLVTVVAALGAAMSLGPTAAAADAGQPGAFFTLGFKGGNRTFVILAREQKAIRELRADLSKTAERAAHRLRDRSNRQAVQPALVVHDGVAIDRLGRKPSSRSATRARPTCRTIAPTGSGAAGARGRRTSSAPVAEHSSRSASSPAGRSCSCTRAGPGRSRARSHSPSR